MNLQDEIRSEIRSLKQNLAKIDRALDAAPDGTLRLSHGKQNRTYYYIQYSDGTGKIRYEYLSNRNVRTISALAQKTYYKRLRPVIVSECDRLEVFLNSYDPDAKQRVFELLGDVRQAYVKPLYLSVKDIVNQWNTEDFDVRSDSPELRRYGTDRGERVRTRSEAALANLLYSNRHRLLYRYEAALSLYDDITAYPTFSLLSTETGRKYYWEHVIVDDSPQCIDAFIRKMNIYIKAGIYPGENLIVTLESKDAPLDMHIARCLVSHYFNHRF